MSRSSNVAPRKQPEIYREDSGTYSNNNDDDNNSNNGDDLSDDQYDDNYDDQINEDWDNNNTNNATTTSSNDHDNGDDDDNDVGDQQGEQQLQEVRAPQPQRRSKQQQPKSQQQQQQQPQTRQQQQQTRQQQLQPQDVDRMLADAGSSVDGLPQHITQYYQYLSQAGKMKLLRCFVRTLYETLKEETELRSQLRNQNIQQLRTRLEHHRQQIRQLIAVRDASEQKQQQFVASQVRPNPEENMRPVELVLFQFWCGMVAKFQPRLSKDGLKRLYALEQMLERIFQADYINYYLADELRKVEPSFNRVYGMIRTPNPADATSQIGPLDVTRLYCLVHKHFRLAVSLARYYQTHAQHRTAIATMVRNPTQTNAMLKQIGADDFRNMARAIKALTLDEKAQLSFVFLSVMKY